MINFDFSALSDEDKEKIEILRNAFKKIDADMESYGCAGHFLSIARTHLETAAIFAIKSVTHKDHH